MDINMPREKLMLYFNTDIEIEKLMWEYINKDGKNRKSYNVKKLLEKAINNEPIQAQTITKPDKPVNEIKTSSDDLDTDDLDEVFN